MFHFHEYGRNGKKHASHWSILQLQAILSTCFFSLPKARFAHACHVDGYEGFTVVQLRRPRRESCCYPVDVANNT